MNPHSAVKELKAVNEKLETANEKLELKAEIVELKENIDVLENQLQEIRSTDEKKESYIRAQFLEKQSTITANRNLIMRILNKSRR